VCLFDSPKGGDFHALPAPKPYKYAGWSIFQRSGHRFVVENATKQETRAFSDEVATGFLKELRQVEKIEVPIPIHRVKQCTSGEE